MVKKDYGNLVKQLRQLATEQMFDFERKPYLQAADAVEELSKERINGTCQTCARSSDMCGDNITRCPIEEHYALPLDGYCHLYEPPKEGET